MRVHMAAYKIIMVFALAAWLPCMAFAMTPGQVYERVKDSVVVVKAHDQQGKLVGLGSGVVLPSGEIITNYHVVKEGVRYTVGRSKHIVPATLKAGDPDKDLCLLHAPGLVAEPARLGRSRQAQGGGSGLCRGSAPGVGTVPVRRDYLPTAGWRPSSNNPDHGGDFAGIQRRRLVQCERGTGGHYHRLHEGRPEPELCPAGGVDRRDSQ
jgi:hypothetical protein